MARRIIWVSSGEIWGPEKSILDESDWTKTRSGCYGCLGVNVQWNYQIDFWHLWAEKWGWGHLTDVLNWHYVLQNLSDGIMKKDGIVLSQG